MSAVSSTVVTGDGVVYTGAALFHGLYVTGTGAISVYDATSATGTAVLTVSGQQGPFMYPKPVQLSTGIYIDLTGNTVTVCYEA